MQDIPKLYTGLAEWLSCVTIILACRNFIGKERKKEVILKLLLSLAVLSIVQVLCGKVSNWLWQVGMLMAVAVMTASIKSCVGMDWPGAAYVCARAFLRAEFLAALEWQIFYFYCGPGYDPLFSHLCCALAYALGFALFYYVESRGVSEDTDKGFFAVPWRETLLIWFLAALLFELSNLSYIEVNTPFTATGTTQMFNIRTLVDLAGVLILELFYIQKLDNDRKQEMMAIQNTLMTHYLQYRESQENIELLNRKYHDLKHQLLIIREEADDEKREEYLDEIEQGLSRYEAEVKTGNSVLDTVLTSKNSLCGKQGITLTVVADGALLQHLHVMDLCTIFGNALDNAIEYEIQVEEKEKRLIHVSVSKKGAFVCVVVENYYEGDFNPKKGLPRTTKGDCRYHGYGLKSIQYSIKKYGGYLNMDVKDNWFRLEMLLPGTSGRSL